MGRPESSACGDRLGDFKIPRLLMPRPFYRTPAPLVKRFFSTFLLLHPDFDRMLPRLPPPLRVRPGQPPVPVVKPQGVGDPVADRLEAPGKVVVVERARRDPRQRDVQRQRTPAEMDECHHPGGVALQPDPARLRSPVLAPVRLANRADRNLELDDHGVSFALFPGVYFCREQSPEQPEADYNQEEREHRRSSLRSVR